MKSKVSRERGQALILIALAAIGLVAITGLAIDGSAKYSDRRHAQNAADTAALAAALSKSDDLTKGLTDATCPPPAGTPFSQMCLHLTAAAQNRATENGYDDDLTSNNVEIYSPPISGPYIGKSAYVQVIITSYVNTFFSRIIGMNQTKNTVEAVSLAGKGGILGDGAMIISYDPSPNCSTGGTGGSSVLVSGSGILNLNGGGIFVNSDKVCGFKAPNCPAINITGGAGINSAATIDNIDQCSTATVPEHINQVPVAIPDDVTFPNVPSQCNITPAAPTYLGVDTSDPYSPHRGEWLIYPGYYEQFPQGGLVANKQHIYMASGVYCIDPGGPSWNGDLSWSPVDFVSLNGSISPSKNKYSVYNPYGVTLYIKSGGGFSINDNNTTILDASTTGDYQGYLIVLEGSNTSIKSCSLTGGSEVNINGMIYAPYCNITINGGSEPLAEINAQLIGWDIKLNGNNQINFTYDPNNKVTIKRRVGLMR